MSTSKITEQDYADAGLLPGGSVVAVHWEEHSALDPSAAVFIDQAPLSNVYDKVVRSLTAERRKHAELVDAMARELTERRIAYSRAIAYVGRLELTLVSLADMIKAVLAWSEGCSLGENGGLIVVGHELPEPTTLALDASDLVELADVSLELVVHHTLEAAPCF